ncbi:hypothetical protein EV193_101125 [Herbihabitans rhizosphaerae]|uniref:Uncharacterized protein n=1 Tax=Herbihabitans rhizosphaerae TaxID=1872711 RepID=A0A4Q7L5Y6_9PSEU|nr:hypothetical protein EV193_101125 [Herbihabitans rhizosphaerae]
MVRLLTNIRFWMMTFILLWLTTVTVIIAGQP